MHLRAAVLNKLVTSVTHEPMPNDPAGQMKVLLRILVDSPWGWLKEKAIPWIKSKLPAVWSFAKGFLPSSMVGLVDSVISPAHV